MYDDSDLEAIYNLFFEAYRVIFCVMSCGSGLGSLRIKLRMHESKSCNAFGVRSNL